MSGYSWKPPVPRDAIVVESCTENLNGQYLPPVPYWTVGIGGYGTRVCRSVEHLRKVVTHFASLHHIALVLCTARADVQRLRDLPLDVRAVWEA